MMRLFPLLSLVLLRSTTLFAFTAPSATTTRTTTTIRSSNTDSSSSSIKGREHQKRQHCLSQSSLSPSSFLSSTSVDGTVENLKTDRRSVLSGLLSTTMMMVAATASASATFGAAPQPASAATTTNAAEEGESMYAPKFVQEYPDFAKTSEGWSYRDVNTGTGTKPELGDRVVYEWSGYTIGYFGRPFEAKGGPQGGAFDKSDKDYERTVLGSGEIVKGLECALLDMKVGGVRQVIVPYGKLSYPPTSDDGNHEKVGPKPTTFSGLRALNFVLDNPRVDRTLLFNVKLVRVDKPDGKGGFKRG